MVSNDQLNPPSRNAHFSNYIEVLFFYFKNHMHV